MKNLTENHFELQLKVYRGRRYQHIAYHLWVILKSRKNMDFYCATHGTNDNQKSSATQNPKLTCPLIGNNASKHVYQTNSRRKRTEKSGTATLLVCGPLVVRQGISVPKSSTRRSLPLSLPIYVVRLGIMLCVLNALITVGNPTSKGFMSICVRSCLSRCCGTKMTSAM